MHHLYLNFHMVLHFVIACIYRLIATFYNVRRSNLEKTCSKKSSTKKYLHNKIGRFGHAGLRQLHTNLIKSNEELAIRT